MVARIGQIVARLRAWYHAYPGLGASADVHRYFMVCRACRRVVPAWRITGKVKPGARVGCKCGGDRVQGLRIATISEWRAGWWYLVRGLVIRRLVLRKREDFDPRMPFRPRDLDPQGAA